jgi:hypothetical protein
MQRTFYLDVKDAVRTLNRFKVRFADDEEVIRHSQELAAQLRHRHYADSPGLTIEVLDQVNRKIHEEPVYPSRAALHEHDDARLIDKLLP